MEKLKLLQQRKKDNQEYTVSVVKDVREKVKEIGKRDIVFLKSFHDSIVENMKQSNQKESKSTDFVVFDIFESLTDEISSFPEEEDIFDN
jgi:hypothetical protein